jgi:hypothetical protein
MDTGTGQFRHYIITVFNMSTYDPASPIFKTADKWTEHRIKLFATFTLPSVIGQTCQNFTWFLLVDERTPWLYKQMLESIKYKNLKILYTQCANIDHVHICKKILENIEPGDYDLITTELDSDDAIHRDTVQKIQYWYAPRPESWMIVFPHGLILDLPEKQLFVMEYQHHLPTLIENTFNAQTVYYRENSEIPVKVREHIFGTPYWLQVVHSKNAGNTMESTGSRYIHKDKVLDLDQLVKFNVDPQMVVNLKTQTSPTPS